MKGFTESITCYLTFRLFCNLKTHWSPAGASLSNLKTWIIYYTKQQNKVYGSKLYNEYDSNHLGVQEIKPIYDQNSKKVELNEDGVNYTLFKYSYDDFSLLFK